MGEFVLLGQEENLVDVGSVQAEGVIVYVKEILEVHRVSLQAKISLGGIVEEEERSEGG